jgi:hypothetical protein
MDGKIGWCLWYFTKLLQLGVKGDIMIVNYEVGRNVRLTESLSQYFYMEAVEKHVHANSSLPVKIRSRNFPNTRNEFNHQTTTSDRERKKGKEG